MTSLSHRTDLHVFHFRTPLPLGGDLDAVFAPREIVDWAGRFGVFNRFVLGNHPAAFFRVNTQLPPEEYLDAMASAVRSLRDRFQGSVPAKAAGGRRLFSGLECDLLLPKPGEVSFGPGERLLSHLNPDVALIALHFHSGLTYGKRYEIVVTDLTNAFRWAISSGLFSILAHPFDVLARIFYEDRQGFEEIADLAREKRVAFEINADKGFEEKAMAALVENNNFFSFGGDFHAFSYWLKRDPGGIAAAGEDEVLVRRILGLTREAADKEKQYWRELDPLFWQLPCSSKERGALRNYAVQLYKRFCGNSRVFERGLERVKKHFDVGKQRAVEVCLRDLFQIYTKWGGEPTKRERMYVERKYLLHTPLTPGEKEVCERWLARALGLGLKKEQLINTWDNPRLERFLHRR